MSTSNSAGAVGDQATASVEDRVAIGPFSLQQVDPNRLTALPAKELYQLAPGGAGDGHLDLPALRAPDVSQWITQP